MKNEIDIASAQATDFDTEVIVIGGGPGGYTAAFRAADLGKKVTLVEKHARLGGVCLNVGCIPSKALLHTAKVIQEAAHLPGVRFGRPQVDLDGLRRWKDGVVAKLTGGLASLVKARNVTVIQGEARFDSPHRLRVETPAGVRTVGFEHAIIAAGSSVARIPGFPYDDGRLIDSTGALELRDVPPRLLVIGGGIIGLEMATVYYALGSKVTVVEMTGQLIPGADADLVKPLAAKLGRSYERIMLGTRVSRLESLPEGLRASFEGAGAPAPQVFDRVLVAVGRKPNGSCLGAEAAGVKVGERGFIAVDRQMRTNVPHIFAIGDVAGEPMLAHKAAHEGKIAAEVIAGHAVEFAARTIPSVAYTDPEVAWMGLTEREAKSRGIDYEKAVFPWVASGRAQTMGADDGQTKLIIDKGSRRVLGVGIVGQAAGELIAEAVLALEMDAEAEDLALAIHPHPTLSETLAFAAEIAVGSITDLYIPKK